MESPLQLPPHIQTLVQDLKSNPSTKKVLLDHLPDTSQDFSLYQVYLRLGYSPAAAGFQYTPTKLQAFQLLTEEFSLNRPDSFTCADLKQEFYRTFMARGVEEFSTPDSLGLVAEDLSEQLLEPSLMLFEPSLMDFWGDSTPQKMVRTELNSETPCKVFDIEGRSSKGLRSISLRVKEILRRRGKATYKEVADDLVNQLNLPDWADRGKEEKNIRRRVYDALNVLISAGVMGRLGREIGLVSQETSMPIEDDGEMRVIRGSVAEKRSRLRELAYNFMSVSQLITRNKQAEPADRIDFPFIVVATEDTPDNSLCISADSACLNIRLKFKKEAVTVGDSDIVRKMPFQKPWQMEVLPKEVRKLLHEHAVYLFA
jgi:hypothetical protein